MGIKETLAHIFFKHRSLEQLLALYGEPGKIYDLCDYFNKIDLATQARKYAFREFGGKPSDPFPGDTGMTLQDAAMGIVFSEHGEKIERVLKRNHRIDFGLSDLVWIVGSDYNRKEYWLKEGDHVHPLCGYQDELLSISKHGQVWWMYTDKGGKPRFDAWMEIEEHYLPRGVNFYRAQYAAVVEANKKSFANQEAEINRGAEIRRGVRVQFIDGTTQIYENATYRIDGGLIIVTPYSYGRTPYSPIILPVVNVKSIRRAFN